MTAARALPWYVAALALALVGVVWAGSAIVQHERTIEVLKTAAARSEGLVKPLAKDNGGGLPPTRNESEDVRLSRKRDSGIRYPEAGIKPGRQSSDLLSEIKQDMMTAAGHLCGLKLSLVASVAMRESSMRWQVHPKSGAVGYMQVMGIAAREVDPKLNRHKAWDNFLIGSCFLRRMIDQYGSEEAGLLAYHAGGRRVREGRVLKASRDYAREIMEGASE